jgi:hypothetical protein
MGMIRRVPDRDPAHRLLVAGPGQASPVHDLFRDPCPLGIGENGSPGAACATQMPHRFVETMPPKRGQRLIQ